jgi:riboflavin biosynthesis pyrimidine reductase
LSSSWSSDKTAFQSFAERKTLEAATARIDRLSTVFDLHDQSRMHRIANAWSQAHYGGRFGLTVPDEGRTALSLVFVQSRDGNTGGTDPSALGGGPTDKHLIYEGLSRVAADGVLAGAGSVHADAFFSIWHPELVALRESLGLPRHPVQIVVSKRGGLDFSAFLFNVPEVPVFLICGDECVARHASALRARPWIGQIAFRGHNLRPPLDALRVQAGIQRISTIGGRFTATCLVDEGLAQDIYLTTTSREGGDAGTPWYSGASSPRLSVSTRKEWLDRGSRNVFEHIMIN